MIFASHNGASRHLGTMLASMRAVRSPKEGVEYVAVDSASADDTRDLLTRAQGELPLTALAVVAPGKNLALNNALDHAQDRLDRHSLVVFTDDDIDAHPDWLLELETAARVASHADIFGGRIELRFPQELDPAVRALEDRYDVLFARNTREEGSCRAADVYGPNMAVRARCIGPSARFDVRIGPNAARDYAMGSETEFLLRLERDGARAWHASRARVDHLILKEHLSPTAIVNRARRHGAGYAQMHAPESTHTLLGAPAWMLRGYAIQRLSMLLAHMGGSEGARLRSRYDQAWISGAIANFRRLRRSSA